MLMNGRVAPRERSIQLGAEELLDFVLGELPRRRGVHVG